MAKEKGIIDKAWEVQENLEHKSRQFGKGKYGRIFQIARKPSREELVRTVEITIVGLLVIGVIGFGIYLLFNFIKGFY
jgi:protein translocase SEC61 complex gamma subunit